MYKVTKLKYVLNTILIVVALLLGSCKNETTVTPKIGYLGLNLGDMKDTVITKLEKLKNNGKIEQMNIFDWGPVSFFYPYPNKYSEKLEAHLSFNEGILTNIQIYYPSKLQYDEVVDSFKNKYKNQIVVDTVRSPDNLVEINYFIEIDSLHYINIEDWVEGFGISYSKFLIH